MNLAEQKVYSQATLDDAFADNRILVMLTNEASLSYLETGAAHFPELQHKSARNLSAFKGKQVRSMIEERNNTTLTERILSGDPNAEEIAQFHQLLCIELEDRGKDKVLEAIAVLQKRDDVLYVGPDYEITVDSAPVTAASTSDLWAPETIDLPEAKAMVTNPTSVLVGVLDSGIDANHPQLAGKVNRNLSANFVDGEDVDPLTDPYGHGTHVAGIIGAGADSVTGMAGVCESVEFVSLRVFNASGNGNMSYFCAALDYVLGGLNLGENSFFIPILNFSGRWKNGAPDEFSPLHTHILNYLNIGGLFICGAGNESNKVREEENSSDSSGVINYPASFRFTHDDNVIVVGGSNQTDNGLWVDGNDGSNWGQYAVDLFAPGDTILSCYSTSICKSVNCPKSGHEYYGYHYMSGTSMATPFVTGVAALILSVHPNTEVEYLKAAILNNVDIKSYLSGKCVTGGRLNAYKALCATHVFGNWTNNNSSSHRKDCTDCDYFETGAHHYEEWLQYAASYHCGYCTVCSYMGIEAHTYGAWKKDKYGCSTRTCQDCGHQERQHKEDAVIISKNANTHTAKCPSCGEQSTVNHSWSLWVNWDITNHRRECTVCGYEQLQTHRECWNSAKNMCMACRRPGPLPGTVTMLPPGEEELQASLIHS